MNPRDVLDAIRLLDSLPASDQRTVRVRAMREAVRHVLYDVIDSRGSVTHYVGPQWRVDDSATLW